MEPTAQQIVMARKDNHIVVLQLYCINHTAWRVYKYDERKQTFNNWKPTVGRSWRTRGDAMDFVDSTGYKVIR